MDNVTSACHVTHVLKQVLRKLRQDCSPQMSMYRAHAQRAQRFCFQSWLSNSYWKNNSTYKNYEFWTQTKQNSNNSPKSTRGQSEAERFYSGGLCPGLSFPSISQLGRTQTMPCQEAKIKKSTVLLFFKIERFPGKWYWGPAPVGSRGSFGMTASAKGQQRGEIRGLI